MSSLELKIPPVVVFLIATVFLYFTPSIGNYSVLLGDNTKIVSHLIFALGIVIGALGVVTFKKANTTVNPVEIERASSLVTTGVFQMTRNPMYLAMAIAIFSMSVRFDNVAGAFWVLPFCVFITRFQIMPEERNLLAIFGDDFIQYSQNVRRWL
ncbi:isoprenylcysteine carboxylmethyltransferase family protein [Glaciecola sp. MH2013]|uniref:methyltransferase family protein n=1 Tax=Glaciecola sp. MH2013 TaxID=2785524 RepID=UPI00189E4589|nr:isoprenylcysteine carboxylmethyltransferase family protein [Glaciecola sp. MH2013]MBF7073533.1 isoprenylcysteine carboxylmethyltransferase family protein [Glaciecola sp. MH2013]